MDRWDVVGILALLVIGWSVWSLAGWTGVIGYVATLVLVTVVMRNAGVA